MVEIAWPTLASLVTMGVAWLTRPALASDDAAISFRYAERLATGHGFTYNDGEHVLGASSALHTVLLALLSWVGLDTPTAAVALGLVGIGICGALVTHLARRLGGPVAAAIALALFVASPVRYHALSGLESATLVALGLAAVAARQAGRDQLAGVALGLAIVTKLDTGALVVAMAVAGLVVHRRLPVRTLLIASVAALPWFLWATWRFGGPLPQSFISKASGNADGPDYRYDPTWVLPRTRRFLPAAAAGLAVVAIERGNGEPSDREARITLAVWLVLAVMLAALLPLGAPYPWYLSPVFAPLAILGGLAATLAVGELGAWRERGAGPIRIAGAAAIVGCCVLSIGFGARTVLAEADGQAVGPAERQWEDFRAAGRFVNDRYPGELVSSCFGWVGYAGERVRITDPCQLTSDASDALPTASVVALRSGETRQPPGTCEVARFDRAARADSSAEVVIVIIPCE